MSRFIQFGAGSCRLPHPWENYDQDVDCALPLPRDKFPDGCASIVFAEMMVEHLKPQDAWNFLCECHRILKPTGLIRIVIPDFSISWQLKDPDWLHVNQGVTNNDGTLRDQFKSILFAHGHQSLWNSSLLADVLSAIGFERATIKHAGQSDYAELRDIEQHWRSVGRSVALSESGCVEAVR
jgi:predicted SAM-dependent methyltransferase